ncbi:fumarylacetoacetate hydrolase family protein [Achromobacter animicus]|uniref:fumarylacetoacetate hydrolase family protein n=1 Tax=Achromobacter animicus TaxID=1389935 RepID=UPI0024493026|nr:fumarylacetoacetate hydrolase family protein [Achromobacter animicus]MDH0683048.1 fumarylacetoacetate hydrolase family protein [Achromobacter animicus]
MKLATLSVQNKVVVASVDEAAGSFRTVLLNGVPIEDMNRLIEDFEGTKASLALGDSQPLSSGTVLAPIPRPRRNIICVGKNYFDHAHEFARSGFDSSATSAADAIPKAPIIFTKMPETVVATQTRIGYPDKSCTKLDYEAELGVIIGKAGLGISKEQAMDHVFGYVIINDLTERGLQADHKQWFLGKSFETSCPMGPWIATADELDVANLDVKCWVNDEPRQNSNTRDLIFDVPTLIETISRGTKLLPGDVIATGTPVGVGIGFTPPRFLKSGDQVDITITGLGKLSNVID